MINRSRVKTLLSLSALALLALGQRSTAATAGSVVWNCAFTGSYTAGAEKGAFTWKVKWVENETGDDTITGTASEEGGVQSSTTGTCTENTCKIDELYTAGPDKGKKFFWVGTYTDAEAKTENAYNTTFKGTWGASPADRKSLGAWAAKAVCKANP